MRLFRVGGGGRGLSLLSLVQAILARTSTGVYVLGPTRLCPLLIAAISFLLPPRIDIVPRSRLRDATMIHEIDSASITHAAREAASL